MAEDASILEKEFKTAFSAEDFMNLDMRHFFIKMTIDGQTAIPTGHTLQFPPVGRGPGFGCSKNLPSTLGQTKKAEVEKEIAAQELISQEKSSGAES